jgi:hypothetical protein
MISMSLEMSDEGFKALTAVKILRRIDQSYLKTGGT